MSSISTPCRHMATSPHDSQLRVEAISVTTPAEWRIVRSRPRPWSCHCAQGSAGLMRSPNSPKSIHNLRMLSPLYRVGRNHRDFHTAGLALQETATHFANLALFREG